MSKQFHQKPLSNLEITEFCSQVQMLLHSGISSFEALTLLMEDAQSDAERDLLSRMLEKVENTGSLYEAVLSVDVFPDYVLHMIKLGEETGTLDDMLQGLAEHYTREENLAGMVRSALIYPSIMLGMMCLIIIVMLTKVMPIFDQVFHQLGQELTGFSAGLLTIGNTLSNYAIGFIIFCAVIAVLLITQRHRFPFQRQIQDQIAVCRFADGMSVALKSGLTPELGLDLASNLIEHAAFKEKIEQCRQKLDKGSSLSEALHESQIFTGTFSRMVLLGEKAGVIDETMAHIASEYEYNINARITNRIAMIEPTLVIILSVIVGIILFSVMLPLLGIMSSL